VWKNVARQMRLVWGERGNDGATGMQHNRVRYYSPGFISEDPIGFAGGYVNQYAYARNSPTNFIDPSGEIALPLAATVAIATTAFYSIVHVAAGRKVTLAQCSAVRRWPAEPACSGLPWGCPERSQQSL
jgi:RHS repeat-associated protein